MTKDKEPTPGQVGDGELMIEAVGLCKFYGPFAAVNDVTFSVPRRQVCAFLGPNGAGNTTCFNMLMGQLKPTAGTVYLDGENITGKQPRHVWRKGVGRTFQITGTYQSMTVIENVQMALLSHHRRLFEVRSYAHKQYQSEAMALLELVDMQDRARACKESLVAGCKSEQSSI